MFHEDGGRPNDQRGFLHKSFIGKAVGKAVTTFVPGASTAVDVFKTGRSFLGGRSGGGGGRSFGRSKSRSTVPRTSTARVTPFSQAEKEFGKFLKFGQGSGGGGGGGPRTGTPTQFDFGNGGGRAPCDFPMEIAPDGSCREPTVDRFGRPLGVGEAVMGRYGAALEPGVKMIERSVCLPGMNLGNDGLCYNKGAITNAQRQWPRGRRPLLTGGDMRAISIAARAGSKLDRTTKRLRSLGMMKALPKGRGAPRAHAHAKPIAAVSV